MLILNLWEPHIFYWNSHFGALSSCPPAPTLSWLLQCLVTKIGFAHIPQPAQGGQHCLAAWAQQLQGKQGLCKPKERPDVLNNPLNAKVYSYDVYRFRTLNMLIISFQKIPLLISRDLTSVSEAKFGRHTSCLFIQLQIRHVSLQSPKLILNKVSQSEPYFSFLPAICGCNNSWGLFSQHFKYCVCPLPSFITWDDEKHCN